MRMTTFCILLLINTSLAAQTPLNRTTTLVNGFDQKIKGDDFHYHSSVPVARESLLIRATDGKSSMEWATSPVPVKVTTEHITFGWLAGIGSSPGFASFGLAVNGVPKFTFHADGSDQWNLKAEDGSSLWFSKDMTDQHGDRFGFMFLTIPAKLLREGEAVKIRVTGSRAGKTSWYMTFRFPLTSGVNVKALPAITNDPGNPQQLGVAGILHFGPPAKARIYLDEKLIKSVNLSFGYNYVRVQLPVVTEKRIATYRLEICSEEWRGELELNPVRQWRVNFVQHSHTDIGYTRPQTEILSEHLRFIDYALDFCDITDGYPDEAKFRWTCESSWAVDEYLKIRPAGQIERLKARVAEGRIEITGMYLNFDELPDEQTLTASLQPLGRIRDAGLEVTTAMQNDVNGIGWSLCDYFSELGVKYLNMGTHGHRALICFDKPTLFWWESPSGNRMLAYRGEHYMIGNTRFKIHGGDFDIFEDELLTYLTDLEATGYRYDVISIQHSGYITDNSPPSMMACEMIRRWNEKYTWPKLRTASATEFFAEIEERYGDTLPVIRGAWPDWWTDGFGASAREVTAVRQAQGDLIANTAGLTMAALQGATLPAGFAQRIDAANEALIFYTEHTVGYHASIREPFHRYTMEQRSMKESYAWEAARRSRMLGEEALGLLQGFTSREQKPSLLVYNPLNHERSGLLKIYIDHQIIPRYTAFAITDINGKELKAQPFEYHSDGTYWMIWADNIPPFGFKKFIINIKKEENYLPPVTQEQERTIMENNWYRLIFNPEKGTIISILDKELSLELVDQLAEWGFGQFIYETPDNREQLESFRLDHYRREVPENITFEGYEEGAVWNSVRFKGSTRAAMPENGYGVEIRLYNTVKQIEFVYHLDKRLNTDPEGIYIAFPVKLEGGEIRFDVQGGEIRAGVDQIPGSSNDWNTVQSYARVNGAKGQVVISSADAPLMQFGGINTGRYEAGAMPATTHLFGWPMNNYWTTNFNADQHGGHAWRYSLTSQANTSQGAASWFGWGNRIPFTGRVLPGGGPGDQRHQAS
ncbi:MAG: glycoside hydrolase family 38 C-terminal domain-containing protein, partial [Bacteroidales bacterium]